MTRWFLDKVIADEIVVVQTGQLSSLAGDSAESLALNYVNVKGFIDGLRHVIEFDPFAEDENESQGSR